MIYVHWRTRWTTDEHGDDIEVQYGNECKACFETRRKYYNMEPITKLKARRQDDEQAELKFMGQRADRLHGNDRYARVEKAVKDRESQNVKGSFSRNFETGTRTPSMEFCSNRAVMKNKTWENQKQMHKYVEKELKLNVVKIGEVLFVEEVDHAAGAHRFERGMEEKTGISSATTPRRRMTRRPLTCRCWKRRARQWHRHLHGSAFVANVLARLRRRCLPQRPLPAAAESPECRFNLGNATSRPRLTRTMQARRAHLLLNRSTVVRLTD